MVAQYAGDNGFLFRKHKHMCTSGSKMTNEHVGEERGKMRREPVIKGASYTREELLTVF